MKSIRLRLVAAALFGQLATIACTATPHTQTITREHASSGAISEERVERNGQVVSELRRIFDQTTVTGVGVLEDGNEGLARRGALALAVSDLAAKVQTEVRSNTTVYQNSDVRDVVETNVHALVQNYTIDFEGYDPGSLKYRVRISIRGESLVREVERRLD